MPSKFKFKEKLKKAGKQVEQAVRDIRDEVSEEEQEKIKRETKRLGEQARQYVIAPIKKVIDTAALHETRRKRNKKLSNIAATQDDIKQVSEYQETILDELELELEQIQVKRSSEKAAAKYELSRSQLFNAIETALDRIDEIEIEVTNLQKKAIEAGAVISEAPKMKHGVQSTGKQALTEIESYEQTISERQLEISQLRNQIDSNAALIQAEIARINEMGTSAENKVKLEFGPSSTPSLSSSCSSNSTSTSTVSVSSVPSLADLGLRFATAASLASCNSNCDSSSTSSMCDSSSSNTQAPSLLTSLTQQQKAQPSLNSSTTNTPVPGGDKDRVTPY